MRNTTKMSPDPVWHPVVILRDSLRSRAIFAQLLLISCCTTVGCAGLDEQPDTSEVIVKSSTQSAHSVLKGEGLIVKRMGVNGLTMNGLNVNGLNVNGLNVNGLN